MIKNYWFGFWLSSGDKVKDFLISIFYKNLQNKKK